MPVPAGELERSVAIYRELLEINSSFLVARREMAIRLNQLRKTQEALEQLELCLIEHPDDVATLIQRSAILGSMRMFEAAEGDLHRALAADPSNVSCHQQLGILMTRRGLWSEALPFLRRAIELDPGCAAAYRHLGDAMNQVDDLDGALQAYSRSIELQPDDAKAYRGLGVIRDRLGQPIEAASHVSPIQRARKAVIRIIVGDLALVEADAVVRPTTTTLAAFSKDTNSLERVAADVLPSQKSGEQLGLGAAIVTAAGNLPADYVIHAAIAGAGAATESSVERAVLSTLQRASDWQFSTIALPPLGAGPGHLVMEATAEIILRVVFVYLKEQPYPTDVVIVVGNQGDKTIFDVQLARISS